MHTPAGFSINDVGQFVPENCQVAAEQVAHPQRNCILLDLIDQETDPYHEHGHLKPAFVKRILDGLPHVEDSQGADCQ